MFQSPQKIAILCTEEWDLVQLSVCRAFDFSDSQSEKPTRLKRGLNLASSEHLFFIVILYFSCFSLVRSFFLVCYVWAMYNERSGGILCDSQGTGLSSSAGHWICGHYELSRIIRKKILYIGRANTLELDYNDYLCFSSLLWDLLR